MTTNLNSMPHSQAVELMKIASAHTGLRLNRLHEYCACLAIIQEVISPRNLFVRGVNHDMETRHLHKYVELMQENLNMN